MNRTAKSKLQYILMLIIMSIFVSLLIVGLYKENLIILIPIVPIIFLIPGRIQGHYYRDFFKARRFLGQKNYQSSIECSNKFLSDIKQYTWRKKLIWLSFGMYSKDIEAMALSNLGTIYVELGDLQLAEKYFKEAIDIDSLYPIPYFNLSIVEFIKGNKENAENFCKQSIELGFRKTSFDKVIQIGQQVLANIEGK